MKILICVSLFILVVTGAQQQQQQQLPSHRYHRGYRPIDTTPPSPLPHSREIIAVGKEEEEPLRSWSFLWEWFTIPTGRVLRLIGSFLNGIWSLVTRGVSFLLDIVYLRALWQDHVTSPFITIPLKIVLAAQFYWALRIMYKILLS
jgi:hypothetical protein